MSSLRLFKKIPDNVPSNAFLIEVGERAEVCQELFDHFPLITVFDGEAQKHVDRLTVEGQKFRDLRYETAEHADRGKIYARNIQQTLLDIQQGSSRKVGREILRSLKDDAGEYLNQATRFRDRFVGINNNLQSISNDLKRRDNELEQIDLPTLEKQLRKSQNKYSFHNKIAKGGGVAFGILGTAAIIAAPFTFGSSAAPGTLAMAASAALIGSTTAAGGVTFTASSIASDAKRKANSAELQILTLSKVVDNISLIVRDIDVIGDHLGKFVHFWSEVQAQIDYLLIVYSRFSVNTSISTARSIKLWKDIENNYNNYALHIRAK